MFICFTIPAPAPAPAPDPAPDLYGPLLAVPQKVKNGHYDVLSINTRPEVGGKIGGKIGDKTFVQASCICFVDPPK